MTGLPTRRDCEIFVLQVTTIGGPKLGYEEDPPGAWRAKVGAHVTERPLTQQYIVGELSSLLAELEPARDGFLRDAVGRLRHAVESSSLSMLPQLAHEALDLTDPICRSALEQRDADAFCRSLAAATALRDFAVAAGLLP